MTTVAFKNGVMAADTQITDDHGDYYLTTCLKIYRCKNGGALIGQSGADDVREIINMFEEIGPTCGDDLPTQSDLSAMQIEFVGLVALADGTLWHVNIEPIEINADYEWNGSIREIVNKVAAVGSGCHFALGAMAYGASAEEAVDIATIYDIYSSTPIQVEKMEYNIKKGKKKNAK